jgi:hypothetical protein
MTNQINSSRGGSLSRETESSSHSGIAISSMASRVGDEVHVVSSGRSEQLRHSDSFRDSLARSTPGTFSLEDYKKIVL